MGEEQKKASKKINLTQHQSRHEGNDRKKYERYYLDLLKVRTAENIYETMAGKRVEETFNKTIRDAQKDKSEKIKRKVVTKAIRKLKNKKAPNSFNRRAEWIKEGESQMIESLVTIFKKIREERKVSNQLKKTKIKWE